MAGVKYFIGQTGSLGGAAAQPPRAREATINIRESVAIGMLGKRLEKV